MRRVALILLILILLGMGISIVSAGGYADPSVYEEWRPATVAQADYLNVVGHFNRVILHLDDVLYGGSGGAYIPPTNRAAPAWYNEYLIMGPITNRCG